MRVDRQKQPMPMMPAGIPGWLQQFLYSQGGMQGLLYSAGGIQGLLQMIQQQAQPHPNKREVINRDNPFGWQDWLTENHPVEWQPDPSKGQYSNVSGFARSMRPEEIEMLRGHAGLRGDALKPFLSERLLAIPEIAQQIERGNNPAIPNTGHGEFNPMNWRGIEGGSSLVPVPMHKYDYAFKYGYGTRLPGPSRYTGEQEWVPNDPDNEPMQQALYERNASHKFGPDAAQILQTLKGAGWTPDKGFGPQEQWLKDDGTPYDAKRQIMLNDLLYSISPRTEKAPKVKPPPPLPEAPDPFVGMQAAIDRDAYVNETLGGGFFGGVIPEQDALNTFGRRTPGGAQDPHFPTPQLRLNPLPGQSKYDTYAGWAADQGAAFGEAPWASDSAWGHAQGYDRANLYQQPPPPTTAWQPTPQFGGWGGTQGWGNTSRNGTNNAWGGNTQQQTPSMSFGISPWDNPWGMK